MNLSLRNFVTFTFVSLRVYCEFVCYVYFSNKLTNYSKFFTLYWYNCKTPTIAVWLRKLRANQSRHQCNTPVNTTTFFFSIARFLYLGILFNPFPIIVKTVRKLSLNLWLCFIIIPWSGARKTHKDTDNFFVTVDA
jgi:hypothetical protein